MAIAPPVTSTVISTTAWGIPLTNEVNRLTTQSDAYGPRITNLETATAKGAWTTPTLLNGWLQYGSGWQTLQYRKIGDIVYIRGLIKSGTVPSTIFTLPTGFRPLAINQFVCMGNVSAVAYFNVYTDGVVSAVQGNNAGFNVNCDFSII